MLILLTCEDCGLQYHFGIGAVLGGAMNLRCNCGGSLHDPESEPNFSQGERKKEMRDAKPCLYVEVECEDCHRTYRRYFHELDLVFQSKYQRAFIVNCSLCGFERVIIVDAYPEAVGGQVAEVRHPLIELTDFSHLHRDAFMEVVKRKVADYMKSVDKRSPVERNLVDFLARKKAKRDEQADISDRARITIIGGSLPDDARLRARKFFNQNPASMWSTFSE